MSGSDTRRRARGWRPTGFTLARPLPWASPLSRVWPGTLIVTWTVLSSMLLIWPTWSTIGVVAAALACATLAAKVPPSVVSVPPMWFWSATIGGFIGASISGGFVLLLRASAVTLLIVWGTSLMLWTSSAERLASAAQVLTRPLGRIGVPVDEWGRIMSMALRALPILGDQAMAVMDTVKLRIGGSRAATGLGSWIRVGVDLTTACLSAASSVARDTGRAMSIRGGLPPLRRERANLSWRDALVVTAGAVAVGAIWALRVLTA